MKKNQKSKTQPGTGGKQAEKSQYAFNHFFEIVPDLVCIASTDGYFKKLNHAWENTLGYTLDELLSQPFINFIHPDDVERTKQEVERQIGGNTTFHFINRYRTKGGLYRWLEWNAQPIEDGSTLYAAARDITEHMQLQQALQDSESRWKSLVTAAPVRITLVDRQGRILFINRTSPGQTVESALGSSIYDYLSPEEQARTRAILEDTFKTGKPHTYLSPIYRQDGKILWYENRVGAVEQNGQVKAVIFISSDVTERKNLELEREQHLQQLKAILANVPLVLSAVDVNGNFILSEGKGLEVLGRIPGQLPQQNVFELYQDRPEIITCITRALKGESSSTIVKIGQETVEAHYEPLRERESITGVVAVSNIVTERKKAEQALLQATERLSLAQKSSGAGIWDWDMVNGKLDWSPELFQLFGLDASQEPTFDIWRGVLHPEDRQAAEERINASALEHTPLNIHYRIIRPQGQIGWVNALGNTVYDSDGTPVRMSGICLDISERKRTEEALRENEAKFRLLFHNVPMSGVIYRLIRDERGEIVDWELQDINGMGAADIQQTASHLIGRRASELFGADTIRPYIELCRDVVASQQPRHIETHFEHNNKYYLSAVFAMETDLYANMSIDITERKRVEEALRESEMKYRLLYEESSIGIFHSTFDGRFLDVNPALAKMLGYASPQEVVDSIYSIAEQIYVVPSRRDKIVEQMLSQGKTVSVENRYHRKNGEDWDAYLHLRYVIDQQGRPQYLEGFVEDITERKRAEKQIKHSLAEKETLLRELYHRTRNNMAVIIALLEMHSSEFDDPRLRNAFTDAQNRIYSMALVHQKLYEARDLSQINLKDYINDLVAHMLKSYAVSARHIKIIPEMDDVFVLIDSAVPCGLILNELISNALKYAFPGEREGEIKIWLRSSTSGEIEIGIADNGIGVPAGFDIQQNGNLGIQSVLSLVKSQLRGQVRFDTDAGVACWFRFQDVYYQPRI